MIARLVAAKLSESLGQTVIVDNRSGANGMIGSTIVAHAAPDGYTLLAATPASHVTAVHLMKNLPFDPVKDFTPIMAAVEPVTALVVNAELPVNSVQELIAYAKANPGKLSYGSSGVGSVFHLTGELFNRTAGVDIVHVPYRGVTQPMQDTAAGTIQLLHISLSSARGALASGKAKVLAILEPQRYAKMPDVPSLTEIVPAFRKPSTWFGFFGPAKMPPDIVARLNAEMRKAITAPDVRAKLEAERHDRSSPTRRRSSPPCKRTASRSSARSSRRPASSRNNWSAPMNTSPPQFPASGRGRRRAAGRCRASPSRRPIRRGRCA